VNPPPKGKDPTNDPFTVESLDNPAMIALAPRGTPALMPPATGNVAPRLGLAYQLGGQTNWSATLRGGAGIFYDLGTGARSVASRVLLPVRREQAASIADAVPLSAQDAAPPPFTLVPPTQHDSRGRPSVEASTDVSVERRARSKSLGRSQEPVRRPTLARVGRDLLRRHQPLQPESEFPVISRHREFGDV
jgi:hypothetical protein